MNKQDLKLESVRLSVTYLIALLTIFSGILITVIGYYWLNFDKFTSKLEFYTVSSAIAILVIIINSLAIVISNKINRLSRGEL